jgi:hypothetical protein
MKKIVDFFDNSRVGNLFTVVVFFAVFYVMMFVLSAIG